MNIYKYTLLKKLEEDTIKFEKKVYYNDERISFDKKIASIKSEIKDIREKRSILLNSSGSTDNILKRYIAELNLKIFPYTFRKNYGKENIKINLLNISMLKYLQKIKRDVFVKHKYELEDKAMDLFQRIEIKQEDQIKHQIKEDEIDAEIMENEKYKLSLIKNDLRNVGHNYDKFKLDLNEYKFKYDMILKINERLKEILEEEKIKYKKLCEKKNKKKNLKLKININDNFGKNLEENIGKNRCFSDKNFFCVKNKKRISLKLFESQKNKKDRNNKNPINMNPLLIRNYKGYKTPLLFLKPKKIFDKTLNKSKLVNAYDFLNIFSNNKKYDTISEFIDSFNTINNSKLSFCNTQEMKSTKVNSISSNLSKSFKNINKTNTKKIVLRKTFSSPKNNNKNTENEKNPIYILRDFLYELIDESKNIIKYLKNKKAEEIRSNYQIKLFISKCIDDINQEVYEDDTKIEKKTEISNNMDDNKDKDENEKKLYLLTYIFDNCFSGLNNRENIIPVGHKNKTKNKNNYSFDRNNIETFNNTNFRCFSSTLIRKKNNKISVIKV